MDILSAGQALRSCATSSRGGKSTTTTTYYSSYEGSGLGSSLYPLFYLLDATLFSLIFVTLSFIGLDVILREDFVTASELTAIVEVYGAVLTTTFNTLVATASELIAIIQGCGVVLTTRFNSFLDFGNFLDFGKYERRAFYALIFAAAFIWLASKSLERLHTLLATRDTHDSDDKNETSSSAAHRTRGGGESDSDSDGQLSLSGLLDEDEVEELGVVDGLATEGFLEDADRHFVDTHGGTTASKQRAPIQGRRLRRPGD